MSYISETLAYQEAVFLLELGEPLPVDLEAELLEMGCDVAALKTTYEL